MDKLHDNLWDMLGPDTVPTAALTELYDPLVHKAPKGAPLLVVNPGGVLLCSPWFEGCLAWGYRPKMPQSVKDRMQHARTK